MSNRNKKWHECNVLQIEDSALRLWRFHAADPHCPLKEKSQFEIGGMLPKKIGKASHNPFWGKLNIAWIPENHAFVRAIQMPECAPDELSQMLEFQIEKLSPAPVGQIVWSYECIPSGSKGQLTVLLILAQSEIIEQQLKRIEAAGYYADRLEVPWCHELIRIDRGIDRIWIRLTKTNAGIVALLAWILDQSLWNAMILRLPEGEKGALSLVEQLEKTAWTGEVEGWLQTIPPITICGEGEWIHAWKKILEDWSSHNVMMDLAPEPLEMASLSAQRATQNSSHSNLLPQAHRTRYRQQYVDGLWARGIGVMMLFYILGVLIYFIALEWMETESIALQSRVHSAGALYTNVLKMQERIDILQEQIDLKFSALDCLLVISKALPAEMSLDSFAFLGGKELRLSGKVETSAREKVTEYHRALIRAESGENKLFASVSDPAISPNRVRGKGANQSEWNFNCELQRSGF